MKRAPHSTTSDGFTLIEIMLVVAVIAVVMGGAAVGLGALTRSKLRSASLHTVSAARFAYNRSVSRGTTTRLVFDFERNTLAVEESESPVAISRNEEEADADTDEDASAVDPWAAAQERLAERLLPVEDAPSPFQPIVDADGQAVRRYQAKPIGDGVQILKLISPHDPEPRESGKGAIYFFPGGITEHAIVQLTDVADRVYSVEIHPLTGRGRVHNFAYEPVELLDEESEVRDRL